MYNVENNIKFWVLKLKYDNSRIFKGTWISIPLDNWNWITLDYIKDY